MIRNFVQGRVYVCIDAANIFYSQQTLRWRVDYQKLKRYFKEECELVEIHFYTGVIDTDFRQNRFLKKLEEYGYEVVVKSVKIIKTKEGVYEKKGNLDTELVITTLKHTERFDTFVLMSGDSDFAPLLDELKQNKKRVIVMSTRGHIAKELLERAKYLDLRKLKNRIIYEKSA